MQKIIDPHVHFFDLAKGDYAWLDSNRPPFWPDKEKINRDFSSKDLLLSSEFAMQGAVHIEAGYNNHKPSEELAFLESDIYSKQTNMQFKSIAFIDVFSQKDAFKIQFSDLMDFDSFVGIRYIFDEIGCFSTILGDIYLNFEFLQTSSKIVEIQLDFLHQELVDSVLNLVAPLADLKLVINHAGFPPFQQPDQFIAWQDNIQRFANLPQCRVKCSGFEMQSREYDSQHVCAVLKSIEAMFGHNRMMLASNFPLTTLSCSYDAYWKTMFACAKKLNLPLNKVFYANAKDLYGFS